MKKKKSEIFKEKVESNPENVMFRFSLGQALYNEGDLAQAITHLTICAESRDDWMIPRILIGKALVEQSKPTEARPILEKALELAIAQHHEDPEEELRRILEDLSETK